MDLTQLAAIAVPLTAVLGLAAVVMLYVWLRKQDAGTERMQEIAHFIQVGANTFLRREFLTITPFVLVLAILLFVAMPEGKWQTALGFVVGAGLSMLAVFIGMNAAVRAGVRTTAAARSSAARALMVAFRGGGTMGLSITALTLLGIFGLASLFGVTPSNPERVHLLVGFGFGASFSALFAQLSYEQVDAAALLSRATAGVIQSCLVFCLPGSPKACKLAMKDLILPDLCHFV